MTISAIPGFPRIGLDRELKKAVEAYWKGNVSLESLQDTAGMLRKRHWQLQSSAGIDHIPSNDFSYYDHVLDTIAILGAVPRRYNCSGGMVDVDTYFAMARGNKDVKPMEMTKWFDTNYHYIVPEFEKDMTFSLSSTKVIDEFIEAKEHGIITRPVLIGPVTYLMLGKAKDDKLDPIDLIDQLVPIYAEILSRLKSQGAEWIQIDEPVLVLDLPAKVMGVFKKCYAEITQLSQRPRICLATYFGSVADKLDLLGGIKFDAIHLDLVRAPEQLDTALEIIPGDTKLSLGVINGRNIWKADLEKALVLVEKAVGKRGAEGVMISSSCSLLHSPIDIEPEEKLDAEVKERMAFATQKLAEINILKKAVEKGPSAVEKEFKENWTLFEKISKSATIHNQAVKERLARLSDDMFSRNSPYPVRKDLQKKALDLPILPTTNIGSFPQTPDIRKARAGFKKGTVSREDYTAIMQSEIEKVIRFQEDIGLDVLVHGEPERNDMVEYFGQMLEGFAFTQNGWVQSYGSRCVKPPVIYGDVSRPRPMTVEWAKYSRSLTDKFVKGMLTGPITILKWSFVREDQPSKDTAMQIALAIRDEVTDLEQAGIVIIQIDEPALKEGTPLRKADWGEYFDWSVKAFLLATTSVKDTTQIHTHMCYSEFNDIMDAIAGLDADVISIEASRSDIELLDAFVSFNYPNEIGPGVYDIHSPRIPSVDEMKDLLGQMLKILKKDQLWVNPDCGLKTRGWPEVEQSLKNMVRAAVELRQDN